MKNRENTPVPSRGDGRRRIDPEAAFQTWAAMGAARSYSAVAREYGVADTTVLRLAKKGGWDKRLALIEAPARAESDERLRAAVKEMNERHIDVARDLVQKGADALCCLVPASVSEALRMIETGSKLERQAHGEPDSKKTLTIETILRDRFEALVVADDCRTIDVEQPRTVDIEIPDLDADGDESEAERSSLFDGLDGDDR